VKNATTAFYNRWIIINFPYTFVRGTEYEAINGHTLDDVKKADPYRLEKFWNNQSISGVLNWALQGLQRLRKQKEFSYTKSHEQNKIEWISLSDTWLAFCLKHVEEDPDSYIVKEDLEQIYYEYCHQNGLVPDKNRKHWKETLITNFGVASKRIRVNNGREQVWKGIRFKPEYSEQYHDLDEQRSVYSRGVEEEPVLSTKQRVRNFLSEGQRTTSSFVEEFSEDILQEYKRKQLVYSPKAGYVRLL